MTTDTAPAENIEFRLNDKAVLVSTLVQSGGTIAETDGPPAQAANTQDDSTKAGPSSMDRYQVRAERVKHLQVFV